MGGAGWRAATAMPLLLELTRALRASRFYLPDDPAQASVLQRAARVWTAALSKSAVLNLRAIENGFEVGQGIRLSGPGLSDLARALCDVGVSSLVVLPGLREDEFFRFVKLLARAADAAAPEPALMRALATSELPHLCSGDVGAVGAMGSASASASASGSESIGVQASQPTLAIGAAEPQPAEVDPSASEATPVRPECLQPETGEQVAGSSTEPAAPDPAAIEPPESSASGAPGAVGAEAASTAGAGAAWAAPEASDDPHLISGELGIDENRIDVLIGELDRADAREVYQRLCVELVDELRRRMEDKDFVDAYRSALVLGRHGAGLGPRLPQVREDAARTLQELVFGNEELLRISVQRAYASATGSAVEAVQLLVALGPDIVPRLLEEHTRGSEEAQAVTPGILVVMGEVALPVLLAELGAESSPARVRRAALLLGEMQHPRADAALIQLLGHASDDGILREVARALARIGTRRSLATLCEALTSRRGRVAWAAAYGLGWSGDHRGRAALCDIVRDPGRAGDQVRLQAVASLARLGGAEATEALADSLEESGGWNRKRVRAFRIAVVEALGRMEGDRARSVLERYAREGDRFLREACDKALRGGH